MILGITLAVAVLYSIGLFLLAINGDKGRVRIKPQAMSWIYGLSLAVYCTSWTFYGAVGTAVSDGWHFLPIYLGPILLFTVGYTIVARTLRLGKAHHSTSIADFLSTRYGKSSVVAALVTVIATVGLLPYVALQLKSVGQTLFAMAPNIRAAVTTDDVVLGVTLFMALFALLFGTRQIDLTQHNRGLVLSIAMEAFVKLIALLAVALFAIIMLIGPTARPEIPPGQFSDIFTTAQFDLRFLVLTILSACAALCLPRQFHMTIVEAISPKANAPMRYLFPGYLIPTSLAVIPITLAGVSALPGGSVNPDMIMLALPLSAGSDWLAILAFIGGFSAATGMVIVTTIALSGMITNDLIVPLFYRQQFERGAAPVVLGPSLLLIRRMTIIGLLILAFLYYRTIDSASTLAGLGTISFAAVSQFAPGLIGGLFWKQGNRSGMIAGLCVGFFAWLILLIIPAYLETAPVFSITSDTLVSGTLISLGGNILAYILFSLNANPTIIDKAQAAAFVTMEYGTAVPDLGNASMRVADFRLLLRQFVGEERSHVAMQRLKTETGRSFFDFDPADPALIEMTERQLSGVLGAASARALVLSTMEGDPVPLEHVVAMFDETSQRLQFSGELLQTAIENIDQGVAVVDSDMKLVAWNRRYVEMFDLPMELVTIGRPIADLIGHNMVRNGLDPGRSQAAVEKRLDHMRAGRKHGLEREQVNGKILRILGNPTPTGGYVTSYTDITEDRRTEQALEAKVEQRTEQLTSVNAALEKATQSKTRFLAAASHDLVQPLNAARLFTSALDEEIGDALPNAKRLTKDIDRSIEMADRLLRTLLDISKLDGGGVKPSISKFPLAPLIQDLWSEFKRQADQKGLQLDFPDTEIWVETDRNLLLSILQNLISNAIRYTHRGHILMAIQTVDTGIEIAVQDSGIGIAPSDQQLIFEEFHQVHCGAKQKGVGLGLSFSKRIAELLGTAITVQSELNKGSVFSVIVPPATPQPVPQFYQPATDAPSITSALQGKRILCIDNDQQALDALAALLERWGCLVSRASGREQPGSYADDPPDIVILDYQLDKGQTGDRIYADLCNHWTVQPPAILITAENSEQTRKVARDLGAERLLKPVAPAALRALINQLLKNS